MPGQSSPCFRCEEFGHFRKECPLCGLEQELTTVKPTVPPVKSTDQPVENAIPKLKLALLERTSTAPRGNPGNKFHPCLTTSKKRRRQG
ncbi:hypothetical protein SNE40_021922 [Patella caerulea]|uniref:CCHC-type domain-containing protein n=1 Tax=Patella caerulea TaxID=87958 RepID=A0AAN8G8M0_PATCE